MNKIPIIVKTTVMKEHATKGLVKDTQCIINSNLNNIYFIFACVCVCVAFLA